MKRAVSVALRADIKTEDIQNIIRWLRNENVVRYLNESPSAPDSLLNLLDNVPQHMLTFHLNREGRFYLVCDKRGVSIGFLRFRDLPPGDRYEVVYVIGEEGLWGQGFGKAALREGLNLLFFENRAKSVTAKIYHDNTRSLHTALRCGMRANKASDAKTSCDKNEETKPTHAILEYSVTFEEYLKMSIA